MEERIIDDEYGRGIRLKKTKDGYVDVTDELTPQAEDGEAVLEEESDEVSFEFPTLALEEDDEDLVGLSNEEAAALRQRKKEAAERRRAEYERACKEGEELLATKSFRAAELKFEKALDLDGIATEASVGYWRAKTADFSEPDVLISEYAEEGIDSLEYDLGLQAVDIIKRDYREVFEKRLAELSEEEKPLAEEVEGKQERRHAVLAERLKNSIFGFIGGAVPFLAALICTAVFGMKITSTREATGYIIATAGCGAVSLLLFIIFLVFTNNLLNALRMYRKNENLASTETGKRLLQIRAYQELCEALLATPEQADEETEEETDEE